MKFNYVSGHNEFTFSSPNPFCARRVWADGRRWCCSACLLRCLAACCVLSVHIYFGRKGRSEENKSRQAKSKDKLSPRRIPFPKAPPDLIHDKVKVRFYGFCVWFGKLLKMSRAKFSSSSCSLSRGQSTKIRLGAIEVLESSGGGKRWRDFRIFFFLLALSAKKIFGRV